MSLSNYSTNDLKIELIKRELSKDYWEVDHNIVIGIASNYFNVVLPEVDYGSKVFYGLNVTLFELKIG